MSLGLLIFLLIAFPLVKSDTKLKYTYDSLFWQINIHRLLTQDAKKIDTSTKITESSSTSVMDKPIKKKISMA